MAEATKPMSEEELLDALKKFTADTSFTINDLKFPTSKFIVAVFLEFLSACNVNVDLIYTPPFNRDFDTIENIDLYDEQLQLSTIKVLMDYIIQYSGVTDLNVRDILEPKPKRTKKILTYVVLLWKHILVRRCMYEELEQAYQAETDQKRELLNEIEETKQQIIYIQRYCEKRNECISVLKENEAKFELQVQAKDTMSENYHKLKTKQADYLKKLRELDVQIESQKSKLEELDHKIMRSPDRLNAEKEQLRQKILEADNKTKDIQLKSVGEKKCIENLNFACKLLTKSSDSMKAICCDCEHLCQAAASLDFGLSKYKGEEENAKRLNTELEKEEEQRLLNEQWLAKENLSQKKQVAGIKEINVMNDQEYEKVNATCEKDQKAVEELQELLKSAEQTLLNEEQQHQAYCEKVHQEYAILKNVFHNYMANITKAVEEETENWAKKG